MDAAVEAYQVLRELGVSVPIAVNMSTRNLNDLSLPDRLEQKLRAGSMPMHLLSVEITESAAFEDAARTMDILARLRLKGVKVSIDDFGTGYSSLKLLRQMPFSQIKIDRSFVTDMASSRDSRAIVKSIIDLSVNMEMACVAEGIETEGTAALLEQMGVSLLQGYLFAPPMPVEAVPTWTVIWTRTGTIASPPAPDPAASATEARETGTDVSSDAGPVRIGEPVRLTARQLEVVSLLAEGCSVKDIARRLELGIGTVKVHISMAYTALGAHNRIEAIQRAGLQLRNRTPST